jgi:hypothetical protein
VGVRVDVEVEGVALFAVGRAGRELGAVGHDHLDEVVIGMIGFFARHCHSPSCGQLSLVSPQRKIEPELMNARLYLT